MPATIAGSHLGLDTHGNRPAANAAGQPVGALYSCSTHSLVYKTDGSSWATYATLGAAASGSITASGYTQATARLLGRTTASTGAIEEITVGSGLSLSAGALTATGAASLTRSSATLGSDVALTTGSWTDILTLSLAAGTWLVWATALVHNDSSGACGVSVQVWDGTTTSGSGDVVISGSDVRASIPVVSEEIVLGSTTTIKLSGKSVANNAHALASTTSTSTTKATRMYAIQVA